jgi:hypothetical protein
LTAGGIYIGQTGSYFNNCYREKKGPFHAALLYFAIFVNVTPNLIEEKIYRNIKEKQPVITGWRKGCFSQATTLIELN